MRRLLTPLLLACLTIGLARAHARAADADAVSFRLQDYQGTWHTSDDLRDKKLVVIAFLGVDCPVANRYAATLARQARELVPRSVAFVAIDANQQDGVSAMAAFANEHKLPFPFLKDVGNTFADQLHAEHTPEVFVLDSSRHVRYRGRIDDQYAPGTNRPEPTRRDLEIAIDELLNGRDVSVATTKAIGCRIGRTHQAADGPVTYTGQIASILRARCVNCHRDGEIAPFSLTSYQQAAGWAESIVDVVDQGRMPPWHASPEFGRFKNDAHLSDDEKAALVAWADAGAPRGEGDDPPSSVSPELWRIPKPDLIVEMPQTVEIPATGVMPYQYFEIDPHFETDLWIQAAQIRPENPSVLHHLVVFIIPPDKPPGSPLDLDFLAAYAPGMPPQIFPEGTAKVVPAGSKLLLQVHYTPRGSVQHDRSRVGLSFADRSKVRRRMSSVAAVNDRLEIPAGASDYQADAQFRFGQDYILHSFLPHMHLRGKSFRYEAEYPDGRREVLLDVPRYQFDWQNIYVLAEPKRLPEGTVIRCLAHYDNSTNNPNNPDPARDVPYGEQSHDEMLVGYMDVTLEYQDLSIPAPSITPRADGDFDVTFTHRPPPATKTVQLAASFNNDYAPTQTLEGPDQSGLFHTTVRVPPGQYKYKYVHDGTQYRHDPANWRQTGFFNDSLLNVPSAK